MKYSEKRRRQRIAAREQNTTKPSEPAAPVKEVSEEKRNQLYALADRVEPLFGQLDDAFKEADWTTKDRTAVRILALLRFGLKLFHGRAYRIALAYRCCRAYHALHPQDMDKYLGRFQYEMARCLETVDVLPDPLIATMHNVHKRAMKAASAPKKGDRRPPSAKKRAEQGGHALKAAFLKQGVNSATFAAAST